MKSLNEKLAEVCGWKPNLTPSGQLTGFLVDDYRFMHRTEWNPAGGNLNQLRECWDSLDDDQKATFAYDNRYAPVDWVFTNPQSVGELILKAKGVEV